MSVSPLPSIMIEPSVRAALLEDLGRAGDLTTDSIVPADARTVCAMVATTGAPPVPGATEVPLRFSTGAGSSSLTLDAQPASSAARASAVVVATVLFSFIGISFATDGIGMTVRGGGCLLAQGQRLNGPQAGSRMSEPLLTNLVLILPSRVVVINTSRPCCRVA